ncbi:MAG: RagB/SusD family nutrient uptake outer membrane protein [Bacteroidales bacterium]|nr:RagB/SusD family nutrient uptake outer membrane protein [Bacteroidales bacterium]
MKRTYIIIPLLTALLCACNALDTEPFSEISPSEFFKSESDLQLFSNAFYDDLLDKSPYNKQSDVLLHQTLSDEMFGGSHRTVPATGGGWEWETLRSINTLLEYIDQCDDEAAVVKYTGIARFFRAFFYFEKVKSFGDVPWCDRQLSSNDPDLYAPRDTREYVMTKMLEDIDCAIETVGEDDNVFRVDKWSALCLKAQFCLFEGTFRKYHEISYDEHDYNYYLSLAADAALEIINSGKFSLYSTGNPDEDYLMLFAEDDANTDEYMLAIHFDYNLGIYHNATAYSLLSTQGRPGLTRKFVNTYLKTDGSRYTDTAGWDTEGFETETIDRDPRMAQSMRTQGYHRIGQTELLAPDFAASCTGYQPVKFVQDPTDGGGSVDRASRACCDLPVYRYGEVLLNYAEAKAELGTLTQNDLDISINLLRDRVGMPHLDMADANANPDWYLASSDYGYPNVTGANQGVILEIRRERTIELLMEGFRWWDLMRWKCGPCIDQPIWGMYFEGEGEYDLDGDGVNDFYLYLTNNNSSITTAYQINVDLLFTGDTGGNLYFHKNADRTPFNEERDYLYPIPSTERSLNPNLTQNPGWNDGLSF